MDTIFTAFAVVGLNSKIPDEYGLEAVDYWLDKFPESIHPTFSKEFVLEIFKFIFENNNLNFDKEYFNQIKGLGTRGTTMGSRIYDVCREKLGEDLGNFIFENWSLFLDDCETLSEENKINRNDLLSVLNSIKPSIQFTMEYSKDTTTFLDILVKRKNEKTWMNIY